jgi:hypothetical protein
MGGGENLASIPICHSKVGSVFGGENQPSRSTFELQGSGESDRMGPDIEIYIGTPMVGREMNMGITHRGPIRALWWDPYGERVHFGRKDPGERIASWALSTLFQPNPLMVMRLRTAL